MFHKVMNKVRSPDRSGHGTKPHDQQEQPAVECRNLQKIETNKLYETLGDGLRNLESSLCKDSVSFQVDWLVLGVSFLHSVHLETFALVETIWLPAKSTLGPDSLNDYLDVSMSLLDTCNNLREGLNQLESYQMSMDLVLRRLMLAVAQLQNLEALDSSSYLKPLGECKKELDRLDATNAAKCVWVELLPKYDLGGKPLKPNSPLPRTFSVVPLPATQMKKKKREVSVVLYDVQVVTSFVSYILLWIITGQAGDKQCPTDINLDLYTKSDLREQKISTSPSPWPTCFFRLKEKVEQGIDYLEKSSTMKRSFMKLQDLNSLQSSLISLRAELEGGLQEGKFVPGKDFAEKIRNLLEQKKQKLTELTRTLDRISAQLNDMFTEIIERRKKVLDFFERRPLYHAFSI